MPAFAYSTHPGRWTLGFGGAASGVAITSKGEKTRLNGWELWEVQQPGQTKWIRIDVLRVA